jgi:hypothetical protein
MLYILPSISPLAVHFTNSSTNRITTPHSLLTKPKHDHTAKMLLYIILSFLVEVLVYLFVSPFNFVVAALHFQPILQAHWNLLIMNFEIVAGEFLERSIRRLLGME